MRSVLADHHPRRAARPHRTGGFLLVPAVLLALVAGLLAGCDHEVDIAPPTASADDAAGRSQRAQEVLDRFVDSVQDGSREDAAALAGPGAAQLLGWVHDNAEALRISDLSVRYVDEGTPLGAERAGDRRSGRLAR